MKSSILKALACSGRYEREIYRIFNKFSGTISLYILEEEGVCLADIFRCRAAVAKRLARTVSSGLYKFKPVKERILFINGKKRLVFVSSLLDRIVNGVLAAILQELCEPLLSQRVFSYRKGYSSTKAIALLTEAIRCHRKTTPLKERGLYLFKTDIKSYAESIDVSNGSFLWPLLESVLNQDPGFTDCREMIIDLVRSQIQPPIQAPCGALCTKSVGITSGLPISVFLFNLCGMPFDQLFQAVPKGFYIRFSDDLLFLHSDREIFEETLARFESVLVQSKLEISPNKTLIRFWNGCGRTSPCRRFKGTQSFLYLGKEVSFKAEIFLNRGKTRKILKSIKEIISNISKLMPEASYQEKGPLVCGIVKGLFFEESPFAHPVAKIWKSVTSREKLKHLDYCVSSIIAQRLLKSRRVSSFRKLPPGWMRNKWKLPSFVYERNTRRPS